jgi:prepilin-type N-terminal cleavage/methylation domain-containing protein
VQATRDGVYLSRGFTLIEVMIVVFLMSLILGITTIFFANTLPSAKHKAAARELAATIKYAKHLAFVKNEKQIINIDLDARKYFIDGRETRSIPSEISITVYENNANANPVRQGKYIISYDTTAGSNWDSIELAWKGKIITIKSDPIMVAGIADDKKNEHDKKPRI